MIVLVGFVVVIACVMGGYMLHGGVASVLLQWSEFLIIGGAAVGSLLVATPVRVLKKVGAGLGTVLKGDRYNKTEYLGLLKTLYQIFAQARKEGLISLEDHVEKPGESSIFTRNSFLMSHPFALDYLCDSLRMLITGGVSWHDLESLMEADSETLHAESEAAPGVVQKMGDALPGLGIVAAVLGIVITMQGIDGPPEEIGEKVAAALVGTFLGILLSYGFMQPIASHLELLNLSESRYLECIRAGLVAFAKGSPPSLSVEFARRVIYSDLRPSFQEMDAAVRASKSDGQEEKAA